MSGKAKFRLVLLAALAGLCGYVGFLVFRERDPMPPLVAGERAYEQEGKSLEARGDFAGAATKYDQAVVYLEQSYKRLNSPGHGLEEEPAKAAVGKCLRLKAAAIRDKHFALAAAAGKPLPETTDTVTGEKFRSITSIPDAKDRDDAASSLRGVAIYFLPNDFAVQLDALRLALMSQPMQWDQIEKFSKAILEIKDDSRAKYLLAKFNFEQPEQATNRPAGKKSMERVKEASRTIEDVKADAKFPIWRAEYLRAQIHRWFMKQYAEGTKDIEYLRELDMLDRLLLDDVNGAIVRINQNEGLERMSSWDIEAVMGLHALATEIAIEEIRKRRLKESSTLARVFQHTLSFCEKKLKSDDPAFPRMDVLGLLLSTMNSSQRILANHQPREWAAGIDLIRPILREEFDKDRCDALRVAQFAELLMNEAQFRRSEPAKADELRGEAKKWLDEGLKFGKSHNFTSLQMLPFNLMAANVCYFGNEKRENAAPFIAALLESRIPQAHATGLLIDGAYDEREGRLEKAREKLEKALAVVGGDEDVRAHASLANIFMALGQPEHALIHLAHLQNIYERYGDLSDLEKQWVAQFIRSDKELYALTAIANLDNARRIIAAEFRKDSSRKKLPYDKVKESEDRVKNLLSRELPRVTPAGFTVRTAWIYYLIETQRYDMARAELLDLNKDYSDRVELLMLGTDLMTAVARDSEDPARIRALPAEVDALIQRFMQANPQNQSAKLFYATWLSRTGRSEQAVAYLKGIIDTNALTPEIRRVAAAILLQLNTPGSVSEISRLLPHDPQIDAILFELGRNTEKTRGDLKSTLMRYESVALSRVMAAEDLYNQGQFEKAAEAFAKALDFTRVKPLALQGLARSMFALANKDPDAALSTIQQISREYPTEPVVLLSYAYVFLVRDEIGVPTDGWEYRRNMASALNEWQLKMNRQGAENPIAVPLTRAEFWLRAGRVDFAKKEAERALNQDRKNPKALAANIALILEDPARDSAPELRSLLAELKAALPDFTETPFLEARIEEYSKNFAKAAEIYERILEKNPDNRSAMLQLVNVYDVQGQLDRAAKLAGEWHRRIPNDLKAIAAEVRVLVKQGKFDQAQAVAAKFMEETMGRVATAAASIKDADPTVQDEKRAKLVEESRGVVELEIAGGYLAGGALNEAEARLKRLPKFVFNRPVAQELLGDIYLQQKKWKDAEAVYEPLSQKSPRSLSIANNLAYLLAMHRGEPSKARDVVQASLRSGPQSLSHRTGDRLPPSYLATVGAVYAKLDDPKYAKEEMDIFKPASQRYPNDPRVQLYLGHGYEMNGDYRQADALYQRAMRSADHPALTEPQRVSLLDDAKKLSDRLHDKMRGINP